MQNLPFDRKLALGYCGSLDYTVSYLLPPLVDFIRLFPNLKTLCINSYICRDFETEFIANSVSIMSGRDASNSAGSPEPSATLVNVSLNFEYASDSGYHGNEPLRWVLRQLQPTGLQRFSSSVKVLCYGDGYDRARCLSSVVEAHADCDFSILAVARLQIGLGIRSHDPEIGTCVSRRSMLATRLLVLDLTTSL
jgi:hypothetical protein